jgi:hypothetical protein
MQKPLPSSKEDIRPTRMTALGSVHHGEMETGLSHPVTAFFLKVVSGANVGSFVILWLALRIKGLFPPHEVPLFSAISWYFIFGSIYCLIGSLFFRYARHIEHTAVIRAMTSNRRYEWRSHYDTKNMTEEDLKRKAQTVHQKETTSSAVNAGANFFRLTLFLILASLVTWFLGIQQIFAELL